MKETEIVTMTFTVKEQVIAILLEQAKRHGFYRKWTMDGDLQLLLANYALEVRSKPPFKIPSEPREMQKAYGKTFRGKKVTKGLYVPLWLRTALEDEAVRLGFFNRTGKYRKGVKGLVRSLLTQYAIDIQASLRSRRLPKLIP